MPYFLTSVYIGAVCAALLALWIMALIREDRTADSGAELDLWPATLAPLPDADELWEPRACPDIPPPAPDLSVALSAIRHPCYQYAARLAAMSWQSHKTLQRSYDMLAFATVVRSYHKMGASYAG